MILNHHTDYVILEGYTAQEHGNGKIRVSHIGILPGGMARNGMNRKVGVVKVSDWQLKIKAPHSRVLRGYEFEYEFGAKYIGGEQYQTQEPA